MPVTPVKGRYGNTLPSPRRIPFALVVRHIVQRQGSQAFSLHNDSCRLVPQSIRGRNWLHRRLESKLPGTAINVTAHSAGLLFSKAAKALNHRSEARCRILLIRFADQEKNGENGLRLPINGLSHVVDCVLEHPSEILSVA